MNVNESKTRANSPSKSIKTTKRREAATQKRLRGPGRVVLLVVLTVLGAVAYYNSFSVPFLFDDALSIQRNAGVRFGEINWNPLAGRALLYVTFTLNYLWTGQDVWSYHLVNLLFHIVNAGLVFFIAEHIFRQVRPDEARNRIYAFIAAAFFLLHPVQTESVTYISSRSELLSLILYLSGFLLFIKWPEKQIGFLCSIAVGLMFVLGVASKETVISLPATVFLYDFIFLSHGSFRPMLKRWRFYAPFVAGGLVVAIYLGTVTLRGAIGGSIEGHLSSFHYFLTQLRVIVRYIYLVFLPIGLNLVYDFRPSASPLEWKVIASFVLLTAMAVVGWLIRKRQPVASFSIFWFFLTLAPTSSVVPIADVIFEHRLYLPLAGVCLLIPSLLALLGSTRVVGSAAILLTLLTVGTILRNRVWQTELGLWEDVVHKAPEGVRGHMSVAMAYRNAGQYDAAVAAARRGLESTPPADHPELFDTLGLIYLDARRFDDAVASYEETVRLHTDPKRVAIAFNNVGVAYVNKWRTEIEPRRKEMLAADFRAASAPILQPARDAFLKSVKNDPTMTVSLDAYVTISFELGQGEEIEAAALAEMQKGETFADLYTVGKVAFLRQNWARADEYFSRAEALKRDVLLYLNHASALERLNVPERAIEEYSKAVRLEPARIDPHLSMAMVYLRLNRSQEALNHFLEYVRVYPSHRNANMELAKLYAAAEDRAAAKKYLEAVLKSYPRDGEALQLHEQLGF